MNREETKKAIEVMQHYADAGDVQVRASGDDRWSDLHPTCTPAWQWTTFEYRIKPVPRTFYAVDYAPGTSLGFSIDPLYPCPPAVGGVPLGRVIKLVEVVE